MAPLYGTRYGLYVLFAFVALFVVFLVLYLLERDKNTSPSPSVSVTTTPSLARGSTALVAAVPPALVPPALMRANDASPTRGFVTVELMGGLGNQLFQLATAYAYGKAHGKTLIMNHSQTQVGNRRTYFDSVYQWVPDNRDIKRKNWHRIGEAHFHYAELPDAFGNVRLHGYFQSQKYFAAYSDEIVTLFKQGTPPIDPTHPTWQAVTTATQPTVSLHVRRADYVGNAMHPVQPVQYYQTALQTVRAQLDQPQQRLTVVVFSDDLRWCQAHLATASSEVDWVYLEPRGLIDAQELVLMAACDHHIIANSTFSWWGALYDQKPNKVVVAPRQWFGNTTYNWQDVYCPGWKVV